MSFLQCLSGIATDLGFFGLQLCIFFFLELDLLFQILHSFRLRLVQVTQLVQLALGGTYVIIFRLR